MNYDEMSRYLDAIYEAGLIDDLQYAEYKEDAAKRQKEIYALKESERLADETFYSDICKLIKAENTERRTK